MRRASFALVTKSLGALAVAIAIVPCLALLAGPLRRAIVRSTGQPLVAVEHEVERNRPPALDQARAIWEQRCAGCHGLVGAGGERAPDFQPAS